VEGMAEGKEEDHSRDGKLCIEIWCDCEVAGCLFGIEIWNLNAKN